MKYLISCLVIILGTFLGMNFENQTIPEVSNEITSPCLASKNSTTKNEKSDASNESTKCLMVIPNAGMRHGSSETMAKSQIYNLFNDALKNFYVAPNEFNVNSNLSPAGKSAQKYDPREDLYIRFPKEKDFDKKARYGILKKSQVKETLAKRCVPKFNAVKPDEVLEFGKILEGKSLKTVDRKKWGLDEGDSRFFTFLQVRQHFSFRDADQEIMKRYIHFRNNCNKAVSKMVNFCLVDPRYDLQYEDMYVLDDGSLAFSNVYCKKSSDAAWSLIQADIYKTSSY